jgi:DnaK suppressor protein
MDSYQHASREIQALKEQERDPEFEESAQAELANYTATRLLENARRELASIDAALLRIEAGVFGLCVDCGDEISMDRLKALPFAIRCEEDARVHEREETGVHHAASL